MNSEYSRRLEKIEVLLNKAFPAEPPEDWFPQTFAGLTPRPGLARSLTAPCRDLLDRGGKRWRPLLALLVCETFGGGETVLPLLPLVEFSHNASLIHDDMEDNSVERRGKPALHLLYGGDTAINSGCFLYFLPLVCIESWIAAPETKNRLWSLWAGHMRRLHLGQSLDIAWHRDLLSVPSIDDYFLMCSLKTGCLARFAALLGLEAAGAFEKETADTAAGIACAAEKLGVGFQILDDVKNLTTGIPGKQRGDDVVEGKKSLPVLLYLHARPEKAEFAAACFRAAREKGAGAPETEAFIAELEKAGVLEESRRRGEDIIGQAKSVFEAAGRQDNDAGRLLAEFTGLLR